MIILKYLPEEINLQEPPSDLTFELEDLATDDIYTYAKLFGNSEDFYNLNTENENYWIIDKLPNTGLNFLIDKKFGIPKSINDLLKLKTRTRIDLEVGDNEDLIADLSKRITMLERLVIRLSKDLLTNTPDNIPTINEMYSPMVDGYLQLLSFYNNQANIADLEDPMALFQKLFDRSVKITEIVKNDYLDKKD